jgi:hypothetical protein
VNVTSAIFAGGMPRADSRTICARRQVTTDPVSLRTIRSSRCPVIIDFANLHPPHCAQIVLFCTRQLRGAEYPQVSSRRLRACRQPTRSSLSVASGEVTNSGCHHLDGQPGGAP